MIQIQGCKNCGQTQIKFETKFVSLQIKENHFCDKCLNTKTKQTDYFFCSIKCLIDYIKSDKIKEE